MENSEQIEMQSIKIIGNGNFQFSAIKADSLTEDNYTLATIVHDRSGSVSPFSKEIDKMIDETIKACAKSPSPENLLLREVAFSDRFKKGIEEIYGFSPLNNIPQRQDIYCGGGTPLFDSVYTSIEATLTYAENLKNQGYTVNGIVFIITDGADTGYKNSPEMIRKKMEEAVTGERIESLIVILIGINDVGCKSYLDSFASKTNLTHYISMGDVTPQKIAKLATFVSQSVSSQQAARGSGGPSQSLPTI